MQYSFSKFFSMQVSSVVFSSKVGREKKRVWRQVCEWLSVAVACLPAAVSLLLLVALFMQISGVSLALTWHPRLFYSEFSCVRAAATSFPLSKHTEGGDTAPTFSGWCVYLQFTWEVGLPPSPVEFSSSTTLTSFPAPGCWSHPLQPGPAGLFTILGGIPLPPSLALRAPHPLCYVSLLFLLLITQFLFFPQVVVGLSRGLC
jgi:hypothetical protein